MCAFDFFSRLLAALQVHPTSVVTRIAQFLPKEGGQSSYFFFPLRGGGGALLSNGVIEIEIPNTERPPSRRLSPGESSWHATGDSRKIRPVRQ